MPLLIPFIHTSSLYRTVQVFFLKSAGVTIWSYITIHQAFYLTPAAIPIFQVVGIGNQHQLFPISSILPFWSCFGSTFFKQGLFHTIMAPIPSTRKGHPQHWIQVLFLMFEIRCCISIFATAHIPVALYSASFTQPLVLFFRISYILTIFYLFKSQKNLFNHFGQLLSFCQSG